MKRIRFYPLFSPKSLLAITKLSYSIGAVLIVFALVLSTGVLPANASSSTASSQQGRTWCDLSSYSGTVHKVEDQDSPWVFNAPESGYISVVGIKSASENANDVDNACPQIFTEDGTSTCYGVSGIGTDTVTVWDLVDASSGCHEISHLEIVVVDPADLTSTPEDPTSTPQDPTSTPQDPTSTPQDPTSTPQDPTSTPQDPTSTPQDPTSTPQDPTSTPQDPTSTPQDPTSTPQDPTSTPQDPTSTPQDPTSTPQDPTSTPQDPTSTPQDPTSTPQDPTSTPQDPTSTPQDPTSTPQDPEGDPTFTPTPDPISTPVPTAPPPDGDGGGDLLIPVTGLEMPFSDADSATKQEFMTRASTNLGLLFFGLGMVFHGAALWKKRSDGQD
ncbi:MAG: hypothetical protein U5K99_00830 [Anaerolineales bacterium]|nr:hypothetical protein [Anaerolineales bacterium]